MADTPLTDTQFWDGFWEGITLPDRIDPRVRWHRALSEAFRRHLPPGQKRTLFEIGCAPGRWIIWLSQTMGYQVAGCDYSPHGVALARANLQACGVAGEVYQLDITRELPPERYDVVLSIGLIEHFADPRPIVARHLELLRPGGTLVLEVPNMAGAVNRCMFDMLGMEPFLAVHNLDVMQPAAFRRLADEFGLRTRFLGYIGGFDPGIAVYNYRYPAPGWHGILKSVLLRRHYALPPLLALNRVLFALPGADRLNAAPLSHMLLGVFEKSGD